MTTRLRQHPGRFGPGQQQHTTIALEPGMKGEIQLTDRQLKLLESRKKAKQQNPSDPPASQKFTSSRPSEQQQPQQMPRKVVRGELPSQTGYGYGKPRKVVRGVAPPPPPPSKVPSKKLHLGQLDPEQEEWIDQPTTTAPTTSWEDSSSSASGSSKSSYSNPAQQFYGQGLKGKARKLYDDTGASFHDSVSEASSSSGPSGVSTKEQEQGQHKLANQQQGGNDPPEQQQQQQQQQQLQASAKRTLSESRETSKLTAAAMSRDKSKEGDVPSSASQASASSKGSGSTQNQPVKKKRLLVAIDEDIDEVPDKEDQEQRDDKDQEPEPEPKKKEESKKKVEPKQKNEEQEAEIIEDIDEVPGKRKPSRKQNSFVKRSSAFFGVTRSIGSTAISNDDQRALLRKVMQSYPSRAKASRSKSKNDRQDDDASDTSSKATKPSRFLWSNRKSNIFNSTGSTSSGSSASQDKAIMKKVLERARKKKLSNNPRKQKLVKSSSTRMKQLLSPKSRSPRNGSPRSRFSYDSGNDEKSQVNNNGRRKRRDEKIIVKKTKSITPKNRSAMSPRTRQRRFEDAASRWASNTPVDDDDDDDDDDEQSVATQRTKVKESGPAVSATVSARRDTVVKQADNSQPLDDIDIKRQQTDVSGLTRNQTRGSKDEEDVEASVTSSSAGETTQQRDNNLESQPEISNEDEIEIKISVSSLSQRYDGSKATPSAISTVKTSDTTPLHSNHDLRQDALVDIDSASEAASSAVMPEGYTEFLASAKKEFTSYEEKAKAANMDTLEMMYSEEPEGYAEFVDTLKAEVSGAHSQLWDSFRSLFRGDSKAKKPLIPSNHNAASFDDKTKDMVKNMSGYLIRSYGVECDNNPQLANDKAVKDGIDQPFILKDFDNDRPAFGQHILQPTSKGVRLAEDSDDDGIEDKENYSNNVTKVASTDSIDDVESDEFEVTLGQHVRKKIVGGPDVTQSHTSAESGASKNWLPPRSQAVPKTPNVSATPSVVPAISKMASKDSSATETTSSSGSSSSSKGSSVCLAPSNDSIYRDEKKGGKIPTNPAARKRRCQPAPPVPPAAGTEVSLPWSGVKLRSVMDTDRSDSSNESIPSSWAKVKLRRVAKKDNTPDGPNKEGDAPGAKAGDTGADNDSFRRILVRKTTSERRNNVTAQSKTKEVAAGERNASPSVQQTTVAEVLLESHTKPEPKPQAEVKHTEQQGHMEIHTQEEHQQKNAVQAGEIIDVTSAKVVEVESIKKSASDAESKNLSVATDSVESTEGSVVVSLSPEKGSTNPQGMKVIVSKRGLMKVEALAGGPRARVIWRLDRDDVKSAMLDMSAFKVKLLLEGETGTKDLSFSSSEQCMKFANALHQMTKGADGDDSTESDDTKEESEESVFVEHLSEEEQRILEEFRQKKRQSGDHADLRNEPLKAEPPRAGPLHVNVDKPPSVIGGAPPTSPLSEISGTSSTLSNEESKVAESYQKMLKLRIPKDAVKHKMEKDSVPSKIMDFVLGGDASAAKAPDDAAHPDGGGLSVKEEKGAAPYRKMLKMMIPPEAVRHKMEKDGVEEKVICAVLGEDQPKPKQADSAAPTLTIAEQAVAASYQKMLKMMIPKEAVEHKMRKDEVDPKIIAFVVGGKPEPAPKKKEPVLTDEEEAVASAYRQMLKLKIPKEGIRHKMQKEGISAKIIAVVLGEKPPATPKSLPTPPRKGIKPGFHWSPLPSGEELQNSIWAKKGSLNIDMDYEDEETVISKHVELFQKRPDDEVETATIASKTSVESKEMAKLIDLNRANNIAISLKAFKDFTNKELAQVLEFLDPHGKVTGDRALFMKDLLPAPAEVKVIKKYQGAADRLVPAEAWFKEIVHIKRIEDKVSVIRTMESFKAEVTALGETFEQLTTVCHQVMDSDKLPDLLEMVRHIGNRMNAGRGEEAAGFKLEFLSRLSQTKGSDRKTTALDLVVMIFMSRNHEDALMLGAEFPDCQEASRIQISELIGDVKNLEGAMALCKKEVASLKREATKPPRPGMKFGGGGGEARSESGLPKPPTNKNLRPTDNGVKTEVSSMHREMFEKRSQFINNVLQGLAPGNSDDDKREDDGNEKKERRSSVEDILKAVKTATTATDTEGDANKGGGVSPRAGLHASQDGKKATAEVAYSLTGAITRVESFLDVGSEVFEKLKKQKQEAVEACKELSEFFCEKGGTSATAGLLGILAEFAANLDRAVNKYKEQQKRERKKNASKKRQSGPAKTSQSKAKPGKKQEEKKSLVVMVNEMLKVAGDKAKEDFAKGLTYDNPGTDKLKEIYELEQKRKKAGSPRRDILSTIEERRQMRGEQDPQAALSELAEAIAARKVFFSPTTSSVSGASSFGDESVVSEPSTVVTTSTSTSQQKQQLSTIELAAALKKRADASGSFDSQEEGVAPAPAPTIGAVPLVASMDYSTDSSAPAPAPAKRRARLSIADRWTRKVEDDEIIEEEEDDLMTPEIIIQEKPDSDILASDSHDTEDQLYTQKKRQQYMDRWVRRDVLEESESKDLEEESDVGAATAVFNKTRQRYINRWASKPDDNEEESVISGRLLR